ncbi:MAG: hypothetical protein KC423_18215 [Anaerolineales bacterium]|nr:hypothetical protein [Anaerolineales bacterium]
MSTKERDQTLYRLSRQFLLRHPEVNEALVAKYETLVADIPRYHSLNGIYQNLLVSAQNANMRAGVIGGSIDSVANLGPLLHNFDPHTTFQAFGDSEQWEQVLDLIEQKLKPRGQVPRGSRSIWPRYCRSILSGAQFLAKFESAADFYQWADYFDTDSRSRLALPMLLEAEIEGFGFALACDFLKELGYLNFAKPDVHIRDILVGLHFCPPKVKDYAILQTMIRIADHAKVTPYALDKVLWLIGSGYFYDDPAIGKAGRIGQQKDAFMAFALARL